MLSHKIKTFSYSLHLHHDTTVSDYDLLFRITNKTNKYFLSTKMSCYSFSFTTPIFKPNTRNSNSLKVIYTGSSFFAPPTPPIRNISHPLAPFFVGRLYSEYGALKNDTWLSCLTKTHFLCIFNSFRNKLFTLIHGLPTITGPLPPNSLNG